MRFKSTVVDGFQAFAVTGTNTISFAITATAAAKRELLGFAVRRSEAGEPPRKMPGFKVFRSVIPKPDRNARVSTWDHPVQSFVWDDFTAKPDGTYEYWFHPLRGTPQRLDRSAAPVQISVRTEKLYGDEHDVFFNRGVASSQLYAHRFGNKPPSRLPAAQAKAALQWLTRDLDEAIVKFIEDARRGDGLRCCFYEFHYEPVLQALKAAIDRRVDVQIIIDAKENGRNDRSGKVQPAFPREENLEAIEQAGLPMDRIILRDANPTNIQHNKFMVLLKGKAKAPSEVWTGSTNLSLGGFSGQTNVGHWVRSARVARSYLAYWKVVATNGGSRKGDRDARRKKSAYRKKIEAIVKVPTTIRAIPQGSTTIFSPRTGTKVLDLYVDLADEAETAACVTLAFGINASFKAALENNTSESCVVFLLLEKKDTPSTRSKKPFVVLNAKNNVYKAWGAFLGDPLYQWVRETNARQLQLNQHVSYIHSKILLRDPLGADPIVVTGSANFSVASTTGNDENMLVIRGNRRVADIYFTEFNRLFNHYYFRAVQENPRARTSTSTVGNLFLDETGDSWVEKYEPGKLRAKRVAIYSAMRSFTKL
jgi:phosphatidylserine/phosphatidylglycerophosphate/cardiolipin synthase-like enzyme